MKLSMLRPLLAGAVVIFAFTVSTAAEAAVAGTRITLAGEEYDPEDLCVADAEWVGEVGVPNVTGDGRDFGFLMQKQCPTPTLAASFGIFDISAGATLRLKDLSVLGFDFRNELDGIPAHCSGGAAYFQLYVYDGEGGYYSYFGPACNDLNAVTQSADTPVAGWTRVRFDVSKFVGSPAIGTLSPDAEIYAIQLAFDEGPVGEETASQVVLDNIVVARSEITKPVIKRRPLPRRNRR